MRPGPAPTHRQSPSKGLRVLPVPGAGVRPGTWRPPRPGPAPAAPRTVQSMAAWLTR